MTVGGKRHVPAALEGCGKYRPHRDSIPGVASNLVTTISVKR